MNQEYEAICTIEYSKDVWLKGWNVKFKKAGKSLCTLYPKSSFFTALVVVGKKEKERVEEMLPTCSEEVQRVYRETKEGMGQRWLMIDLYKKDNVYLDVLNVIHIRRSLKHGRKYECKF